MSRRPSPAQSDTQSPAPSLAFQRKTLPIKRADGEPLTRADLQYDLLYHIFNDKHPVFTDPHPTLNGHPALTKVCFRDLYINAIVQSPKATKGLKEKMLDVSNFATDFAKLALLVNVGRINTTMSFFPEMKTAVRSYHPVPALQRTNGNLQDAPRIKHILKACLLEGELKSPHSTPSDILARARSGQVPPTTITNLIFVMANHATPLAQAHFSNNLDFLDIFLPGAVSSASRARAFLWLCYHYLEAPSSDDDDYDGDNSTPNPFSDPRRNPGKIPAFVMLTPAEADQENVDTEEEKALGEKLISQRTHNILKNQGTREGSKGWSAKGSASAMGEGEGGAASGGEIKPKLERDAGRIITAKQKKAASDKLRRARLKEKARERELFTPVPAPRSVDDDYYDSAPPDPPPVQNQYPQREYQYQPQPPPQQLHPRPPPQPTYRRISSPTPEPPIVHPRRYTPYKLSPVSPAANASKRSHKSHLRPRPHPIPKRTMLQHAWHVITTSDPLLDSDEDLADEHVRHDYIQRLQIISRLRGKEPTPEPERLALEMGVAPCPP